MRFDLIYTQKQPAWPGSSVSTNDRKLLVIDEESVEGAKKAVEKFLASQAGTTVAISLCLQDGTDPRINFLAATKESASLVQEIERALAALRQKEDGGYGTFKTGFVCRLEGCAGEIVREVRREYRGDPMHQIVGPGGLNQLSTVTSYYCPVCQIMYRGLPTK